MWNNCFVTSWFCFFFNHLFKRSRHAGHGSFCCLPSLIATVSERILTHLPSVALGYFAPYFITEISWIIQ